MVRREGFEPPAFWSVGCLKAKSESFRLRFVLFATVRSADIPLFPSGPARFFRILGQKWVRSCREESGTVYNPAIQKAGENAGGMSTGAVPVTFRVEKRTFRADGPARRGKYATLNIENRKTARGRPRTRRGDPYGIPLCPRENDSGGA